VQEGFFFFEKKKQKTFFHCVRPQGQPGGTNVARNGQKFFGSFFQKRTPFFICVTWHPELEAIARGGSLSSHRLGNVPVN
jgi:hypothetical protein